MLCAIIVIKWNQCCFHNVSLQCSSVSCKIVNYHGLGPKQIASLILLNEHSKGRKCLWTTAKDQTSLASIRAISDSYVIQQSHPCLINLGLQKVGLSKLLKQQFKELLHLYMSILWIYVMQRLLICILEMKSKCMQALCVG